MKNMRYGHVYRLAARCAVLLVLPLVGLAGCDLITGSDDDGIEGVWALTETTRSEFLEITSGTLDVYMRVDSCYYVERLIISEHQGDRYTMTDSISSFSFTLRMYREGDNLVVENGNALLTYQPSSQNLSELERCAVQAGGGDDPSIACSSLPAITIGEPISGDLTTSDDLFNSRYYDLYGLTVSSETQVQIDALSDVVDTYLYFYGADGTYIAENDDGGADVNARLTGTVQPGCYRVEVTSFGDGETGPYTLSVN
ncbi:MAG: PPC domain-containing protein [Candidatus Longimicrobiales bacterium M2_2A_002]